MIGDLKLTCRGYKAAGFFLGESQGAPDFFLIMVRGVLSRDPSYNNFKLTFEFDSDVRGHIMARPSEARVRSHTLGTRSIS